MARKLKDTSTLKDAYVKPEDLFVEEGSKSKRGKKKRPYPIESFEESLEFCKTLY